MSFSLRKKVVVVTLVLTLMLGVFGTWRFARSYAEVEPVRFSHSIVKDLAVGDYEKVFGEVASDSPLAKATANDFTSLMQKDVQFDNDPQVYLVSYINNKGKGDAKDSSTVVLQINSKLTDDAYRMQFQLVKENGEWRINDFSYVKGLKVEA